MVIPSSRPIIIYEAEYMYSPWIDCLQCVVEAAFAAVLALGSLGFIFTFYVYKVQEKAVVIPILTHSIASPGCLISA